MQPWICSRCEAAWDAWVVPCPNYGPITSANIEYASPEQVFSFPANYGWSI